MQRFTKRIANRRKNNRIKIKYWPGIPGLALWLNGAELYAGITDTIGYSVYSGCRVIPGEIQETGRKR